MATPAPGTLGSLRVDPDSLSSALNQPVEDSRAPLEMDEAGLAHERIGAEQYSQVGTIKVR